MAYVSDCKIKQTLGLAFAYAAKDKKGKGGELKRTLSSAINCAVATAPEVSRALELASKAARGPRAVRTKDKEEIIGWHFQQDFKESPDDLAPEKAHAIGIALAAELFPDFPCVVGTHTNTAHVHNHIVIGAWGMDGKKHNNSNEFYQRLRRVSDRLCDEHGLNVMDATRDVKLAKWTDGTGRTRFYEPTERKRETSKKKQYAKHDDYRDTDAYNALEADGVTNRRRIAGDIDRLVTEVSSYEQLLDALRAAGYEVRARKKDGGWMEHVSFKAPGQQKATRDHKLDDGGYYTREQLTRTIETLAGERLRDALAPKASGPESEALGPERPAAPAGERLRDALAPKAPGPGPEALGPERPAASAGEDTMMTRPMGIMAEMDVEWEAARKKALALAEEGRLKGLAYGKEGEIRMRDSPPNAFPDALKAVVKDGDAKASELRRQWRQTTAGAPLRNLGRTQYLIDCINADIKCLGIMRDRGLASREDLASRIANLAAKEKDGSADAGEMLELADLRLVHGNLGRIDREEGERGETAKDRKAEKGDGR